MHLITLVAAAIGLTTLSPAPSDLSSVLFSFVHLSTQSCLDGASPVQVIVSNPTCQIGVPEPGVGRETTCNGTNAVYRTFEVVDGQCVPNVLSQAAEDLQTCSMDASGAITRKCGEDFVQPLYNPWTSPESVHSVELRYEMNTKCEGEPSEYTFTTAGVCVPFPDDPTGTMSAYTGPSGTYQLFNEPGCNGTQATNAVRPAEACVANADDGSSSIIVMEWTCPHGCVHDYEKIGIDNLDGMRLRQMRRRLLFGSFGPKSTCPAHCTPTVSAQ